MKPDRLRSLLRPGMPAPIAQSRSISTDSESIKDPWKEFTNELQISMKEPVKESTKEPTKEHVKEAEPIKEPIREPVK